MGIADGLRHRLGVAMQQMGGAARSVVLRSSSEVGGDALIGIRGTESVTDVEVLPTPFVTKLSFKDIQLSQGRLSDGDFAIVMPPTGYTKAFIESCTIFVDGVECHPYEVKEWAVENQVVWMKVTASRKHKVGHQE